MDKVGIPEVWDGKSLPVTTFTLGGEWPRSSRYLR